MKELYFITGGRTISCITAIAKETSKQYTIKGNIIAFKSVWRKDNEMVLNDTGWRDGYCMFSTNKDDIPLMITTVKDKILDVHDKKIRHSKDVRSSICSPVEYKENK